MPMILLLLIVVAMIGGVFTTWQYAISGALSCENDFDIKMAKYVQSEVPSGGEGERHADVVNKITDDNNGFNNPNSHINQIINERKQEGRDTFSSFDTNSGNQVREELGIAQDAEFIVQFPSDNLRYVFTSTMERGQSGSFWTGGSTPNVPVGEYIYIIYRTQYTLDVTTGKWETGETIGGYAKAADYANTHWLGLWNDYTPAFDPSTWQAGKIGTGKNDAIYAYHGMTSYAVIGNATDRIYYKITANANTLKVYTMSDVPTVKVSVMNNKGKSLKVTKKSMADGSIEHSFKTTSNNNYYIAFEGDDNINFRIQ